MNTFGQISSCDGKARLIVGRVREQPQTVDQTQSLKHGRVDTNAHGVISRFNPPEGRSACKSSFGDDFSRQASSTARVSDVEAKLSQASANRQ